ncbi:hypothetical protein FQN54_002790 [Arachnomyces sp. PD_36]|nr:hypothetical protein FQN54_002790 [Arachnomyces sp. PD_36]
MVGMVSDEILNNLEPSAESLALFHSLRDRFDPSQMLVKASSAQRLRSSQPQSQDFKFSVLDLIASMIHDLAINIYEGLHSSKHVSTSASSEDEFARPSLPNFHHPKYRRYPAYPRGPMELVGYWMELRIFGGVPVFEHGNPPGEPTAAWIHLPFRGIAKLSEEQLDTLVRSGQSSPSAPPLSSILPFSPQPDARGVPTQDAYEHGLFRNIYEHHRPPAISNWGCVRRDVTYPDWLLEYLKKT